MRVLSSTLHDNLRDLKGTDMLACSNSLSLMKRRSLRMQALLSFENTAAIGLQLRPTRSKERGQVSHNDIDIYPGG
jgi:hypothetical protein